jgi:hypothetical protein
MGGALAASEMRALRWWAKEISEHVMPALSVEWHERFVRITISCVGIAISRHARLRAR